MTAKLRALRLRLPRLNVWTLWLAFLGLMLAIGLTGGILVFWVCGSPLTSRPSH
jgi:hypothetical protein